MKTGQKVKKCKKKKKSFPCQKNAIYLHRIKEYVHSVGSGHSVTENKAISKH